MQYVRKLGVAERLASLINSAVPHNVIAMVTISCLDNIIDFSKLAVASMLLQRKHPLMSCIVKDDSFYRKAECESQLKILDVGTEPMAIAEKALQIQLSDGSSLFKVLVCPGEAETSILLLAQHTICDGKSIVAALLDLLSIYDELLCGKIFQASESNIVPSLECMLPNLSSPDFLIKESELREVDQESVYDTTTGLRQCVFSKRQSIELIEAAKKIGVSVQSLFLASAFLSLEKFKSFESTTIGLNIMISMRPYLTSDISDSVLGFYSSYIHLDYYTELREKIRVAKNIDRQVRKKLEERWHFSSIDSYKNLLNSGVSAEDLLNVIKIEQPTFGLSNVGVISSSYKFKTIKLGPLLLCASSNSYSRNEDTFFICLATYNDQISFVLHHSLPSFTRERAALFAKDVHQRVLSFSREASFIRKARTVEIAKHKSSKLKPVSKLLFE